MQNEDRKTFVEILTGLGEIYDNKISKVMAEIYWEALKDYPLSDFKKAANNIVKTHKYASFPKPAHFIEYINPPEDLDARVAMAGEELSDKLCDGDWESFQFKDPIINLVIDRWGGWIQVCKYVRHMTEKDRTFWFKDFERLYRAYARQPLPENIPRMIGSFQEHNEGRYSIDDKGQPVIGLNNKGERVPLLAHEGKKMLETQKLEIGLNGTHKKRESATKSGLVEPEK